eukprot:1204985-Amphidinium_carterae.1
MEVPIETLDGRQMSVTLQVAWCITIATRARWMLNPFPNTKSALSHVLVDPRYPIFHFSSAL